jgi:hypothetical protein
LEFFNLKVTSKGVEALCSPNLVVACKLEDEEGGGDEVRIACIDRLYNLKYKKNLLLLDTKIKDSKLWGIKFKERDVSTCYNPMNFEIHSNNLHINK